MLSLEWDILKNLDDCGVQTLNDIKYIPEFRKNPISLGTVQENGFSYRSHRDRDILKVGKDALTVMREKRTISNIYKLLGCNWCCFRWVWWWWNETMTYEVGSSQWVWVIVNVVWWWYNQLFIFTDRVKLFTSHCESIKPYLLYYLNRFKHRNTMNLLNELQILIVYFNWYCHLL